MRLISYDFSDGGEIPSRFTCDGSDDIPRFDIRDVPEKTESFAFICYDPDSPKGDWDHWVAYDIPGDTSDIHSEIGTQGLNSWGRRGYGGPCPSQGKHRYHFVLYALDKKLGLGAGASRRDLERAVTGHVLDTAEYMGTYIKIENR